MLWPPPFQQSQQGWDLSDFSYNGISKYVGADNYGPTSVRFSPDGLRMFILGASKICQYILTEAKNVSTAVLDYTYALSGSTGYDYSFCFNSTGTAILVAGGGASTTRYVWLHTLTTAYELRSASYTAVSPDLQSTFSIDILGIQMHANDLKMYLTSYVSTTTISLKEFTFTTELDITTASLTNTYSVLTSTSNMTAIDFAIEQDGSSIALFYTSSSAWYISQIDFGSQWDFTAPTQRSNVDVTSLIITTNCYGFDVDYDGLYAYTCDYATDTVVQLTSIGA